MRVELAGMDNNALTVSHIRSIFAFQNRKSRRAERTDHSYVPTVAMIYDHLSFHHLCGLCITLKQQTQCSMCCIVT